MFNDIRPDIDLPQEVLHDCAQELSLLNDLFSAVRESDLALSDDGLTALSRKLAAIARAVKGVAVQITPANRPRAA